MSHCRVQVMTVTHHIMKINSSNYREEGPVVFSTRILPQIVYLRPTFDEKYLYLSVRFILAKICKNTDFSFSTQLASLLYLNLCLVSLQDKNLFT